MQVTAKAKFIRTSPRKSRVVIDLVRGLNVNDALNQLQFTNKKVTGAVTKLINSAIANAENNFSLDRNNLFIKEIKADSGPTLKRWMPRAHGRATPLRKTMSHINVVLAEIKDSGVVKPKKQEIEAPVKLGEEKKESASKATADKAETKKPASKKVTDSKKAPVNKKDESTKKKDTEKEKGKEIIDPRGAGRGGHASIEGGKGNKGFMSKMFRRKSG